MINMVNTSMDPNIGENLSNQGQETVKKPLKNDSDDQGNFAVLGHVKIFDPNNQQIYIEMRE